MKKIMSALNGKEIYVIQKGRQRVHTVKRPKFGNGPLVRHPLSKLLKNHISARTGVSNLVQRGDWLYIFFLTNKKRNNRGSPFTLYEFQQLGHGMSKLGFEIMFYFSIMKDTYFGGSSE
jgi:hypothetical protein